MLDKNGNWFNLNDGLNNIQKPAGFDDVTPNQALREIFYQYNHKSERQWMEWMREQSTAVKSQALILLNNHLESPAKQWGPVTEEALGTTGIFKNEGADSVLSRFFMRAGKLWGEYKIIPNLYKRAASALAIVSPQAAIKSFTEEFDRKSNIQYELERKRILIEALPKIGTLGIGLMTDVITNSLELIDIRMHALRTAAKFEAADHSRIVIEVLKHLIKRFANLERDIEDNERQIVEDIFTAAAKQIGDKEFVGVFEFACHAGSTMRKHALRPLIKRLKEEKENLSVSELYAMTLLKDDKENSLRRAIASVHGLEEDEIQSLCIAAVREDPISEEILLEEDISQCSYPIPRPYYQEFEKFAQLYEPPTMISQHPCQKGYGGVLVTGDNELEKIYFARAFAESKGLNFGYVNIATINNKEDYTKVSGIFTSLRKPYLLYIDHPELMYPSDKSQAASYRIKFAQTLYTQALDTKSYLFGSIKHRSKEIESSTTMAAVKELRANFFAQVYEINKREEKFKTTILEDCFISVAPHRISNRPEMAHNIIEKLKNKSHLEFSFETLQIFATMLLVFGRSVSVEQIDKLKARFTNELREKVNSVKRGK